MAVIWSGLRNTQWLLIFITDAPHWVKSHLAYRALSHTWLTASTCFYWNHKCFTWDGYGSSQPLGINHQYATLMSPNKDETAVCGSWTFVCLITNWLPQIGLCVPPAMNQIYWPSQVAVTSSDYCHLSPLGKVYKSHTWGNFRIVTKSTHWQQTGTTQCSV